MAVGMRNRDKASKNPAKVRVATGSRPFTATHDRVHGLKGGKRKSRKRY